jgi:hypothetical protein
MANFAQAEDTDDESDAAAGRLDGPAYQTNSYDRL